MDDSSSTAPPSTPPQLRFGKIDDLASRVSTAIDGARNWLFSQQHEDGYWCGELEADSTLESDYILLHTLLGTGNPERFQKCVTYILRHQNEDGGWPIYNGGPSNISASVKAYFSLKLAGYKPDHPALERARKKILELGGVTKVSTITMRCPRFRQKSCCFRTGSGSISTKFRRGRAPFSFRFPSFTPRSHSRKSRTRWRLTNCSLAAATNRA